MGMGSRENEGDWGGEGGGGGSGGGEPRRERGGDTITKEWYRRKHLLVGKRMKWGVAATEGVAAREAKKMWKGGKQQAVGSKHKTCLTL